VNQLQIRRVPTSLDQSLTAHSRGQPEPNVLSFPHCAGSLRTCGLTARVPITCKTVVGRVMGFSVRPAWACRNPARRPC